MKNVYKLLMLSVLLLASPYALADEPLFTRYTFYLHQDHEGSYHRATLIVLL